MRQISELAKEDFSLLEAAVATGSGVQMELGEDLSASVAEQLDDLLERLKTEKKGRVSVDSGAVSDMDSGSGTALEEEESSGNRGKVECTSSFPSHVVEDASKEKRGVGFNSVVNGQPQVEMKHGSMERKTLENKTSSSSSSSSRRQYMKRKGGLDTAQRETNDNRTDFSRTFPVKPSGSHNSRHSEQRFRSPRAEVIEHPPPHRRFGDSGSGRSKTAPLASSDKPDSEVIDSREGSPTEGGPFITHWGKGRWRRNGSGAVRDRGRRQYNPNHYTSNPRGPKVGSPGVNKMRYPPSRGRSFGYHPRPERDSLQGVGSDKGQDKGLQQKREDVVGSQQKLGKPLGNVQRDTYPQQRQKEENSVVVPRGENSSDETTKKDVAPDTMSSKSSAAPMKTTTELSAKHGPQLEKSQKKLSYASVTSSSSGCPTVSGKTARSSPKPPPAPGCPDADSHEDKGSTAGAVNTSADSSNCPTVTVNTSTAADTSSTGQVAANSVTATKTIATGTKEPTNDPITTTATKTTATATKGATTKPTTATKATKDATTKPINATKVATANGAKTTATATKGATTKPNTATKATKDGTTKDATTKPITATKVATTTAAIDATTKPSTTTKATKDATNEHTKEATIAGPEAKDHTRPTDATANSISKAIAASFNYSEVVEFLREGEL